MRWTDVTASLNERVFKGPRPLALLSIGALLCVIHSLTAPFRVTISLMVVSLVVPFAVLGIGPIPWQWTGDNAPRAGVLRGLLQALIIGTIWMGLMFLYLKLWGPDLKLSSPAAVRINLVSKLGLAVIALVWTIGFGWILAEQEYAARQKRTMEALFREAKSKALQNQLEPHVLYNALNSLAGLIHEDKDTAEEVIILLAELYRRLTKQGDELQIPLDEERSLVEAYLIMEHIRLGDRLVTKWNWADGGDQAMVPPLVLQTLVENAIKHGISPTREGGTVVITYDRHGEAHRLQVANTGRAPGKEPTKGVGLSNLATRLALWPDAAASLEIIRQEDWTLATVQWVPKEGA